MLPYRVVGWRIVRRWYSTNPEHRLVWDASYARLSQALADYSKYANAEGYTSCYYDNSGTIGTYGIDDISDDSADALDRYVRERYGDDIPF